MTSSDDSMSTGQDSTWDEPWPVSEADLAFPARGVDLTPAREVFDAEDPPIDENWCRLAEGLFVGSGWENLMMSTKDGVDPEAAMLHLRVVLGCYGTRHQDKIEGCGWLLYRWFDAAIWGVDLHNAAGDPDVADALRAHAKEVSDGAN